VGVCKRSAVCTSPEKKGREWLVYFLSTIASTSAFSKGGTSVSHGWSCSKWTIVLPRRMLRTIKIGYLWLSLTLTDSVKKISIEKVFAKQQRFQN
jgi:hypothetical protein